MTLGFVKFDCIEPCHYFKKTTKITLPNISRRVSAYIFEESGSQGELTRALSNLAQSIVEKKGSVCSYIKIEEKNMG